MDNAVILKEVQAERKAQDDRFGVQPRSMRPTVYLTVLCEELGEVARAIIEGDSKGYREELIQLAAVSVAAVEDYDQGVAIHHLETVCPPIKYALSLRLEAEML